MLCLRSKQVSMYINVTLALQTKAVGLVAIRARMLLCSCLLPMIDSWNGLTWSSSLQACYTLHLALCSCAHVYVQTMPVTGLKAWPRMREHPPEAAWGRALQSWC